MKTIGLIGGLSWKSSATSERADDHRRLETQRRCGFPDKQAKECPALRAGILRETLILDEESQLLDAP